MTFKLMTPLALALLLAGTAGNAQPIGIPTPPAGKLAGAPSDSLRVFALTSLNDALESVLPQAEQAVHKKIVVEYGASRGPLYDEITAGQDFEVAILLPDTSKAVLEKGKVKPGTYEIAEIPVALGLRGDAPANLDVKSEAGLKAAMLGAKSVKYGPTGAAVATVKAIFTRLKIDGKVKDTSAQTATVTLGPGEYEIDVFPYPEIVNNKALKNLGNVIAPMQRPAGAEATIGMHANDPQAALAFIKFLQSPTMAAALKNFGINAAK